jgi:hypothetical protein
MMSADFHGVGAGMFCTLHRSAGAFIEIACGCWSRSSPESDASLSGLSRTSRPARLSAPSPFYPHYFDGVCGFGSTRDGLHLWFLPALSHMLLSLLFLWLVKGRACAQADRLPFGGDLPARAGDAALVV